VVLMRVFPKKQMRFYIRVDARVVGRVAWAVKLLCLLRLVRLEAEGSLWAKHGSHYAEWVRVRQQAMGQEVN